MLLVLKNHGSLARGRGRVERPKKNVQTVNSLIRQRIEKEKEREKEKSLSSQIWKLLIFSPGDYRGKEIALLFSDSKYQSCTCATSLVKKGIRYKGKKQFAFQKPQSQRKNLFSVQTITPSSFQCRICSAILHKEEESRFAPGKHTRNLNWIQRQARGKGRRRNHYREKEEKHWKIEWRNLICWSNNGKATCVRRTFPSLAQWMAERLWIREKRKQPFGHLLCYIR